MKVFLPTAALALCAACTHSGDISQVDRKYQRVDYYESTFAPMASACNSAGGFLIYVIVSGESLGEPGHSN
jgi:hypothetical protein